MSTQQQPDEYDLIVIGAGPVGENVADRAVQGGLSAVIVERELVGGECSYWACMPSKALLRPGQALRAARQVPGAAEAVTGELDTGAVLARRDAFTSNWRDDGQVQWLDSAGITLVRGHGRLSGEREVTVTASDGSHRLLRARSAVAICTGSEAVIPPVPGLAESAPWTSREATSAQHVPDSLIVIGAGVVGVEMATAFATLGATVTVLARGGVLGAMEPLVGERVAEGLRGLGVDVRIGSGIANVSRDDAGVTVTTTEGERITAAEVLVATGRRAATSDIGVDLVGLEAGRPIEVDDTMQVPTVPWLYAVGDANGRALLTHQGKYQARAAGDAIVARASGSPLDTEPWGRHVATADHGAVPQVVFAEPEVASVGLTAEAAESAGLSRPGSRL